MLVDAAGLLVNEAQQVWQCRAPRWVAWVQALRAAEPVPLAALAVALKDELRQRPEADTHNSNVCLLWESTCLLSNGVSASLVDLVQNSQLPNGYLPSVVQEVLMLAYGGAALCQEVLQLAAALRAQPVAPPPPPPAPTAVDDGGTDAVASRCAACGGRTNGTRPHRCPGRPPRGWSARQCHVCEA